MLAQKIFLFLFATFISWNIHAHSTPIILSETTENYSVATNAYYFSDSCTQITIENILANENLYFKKSQKNNLMFGYSSNKHWIHFSLYNPTNSNIDLYIKINHRFFYEFDFFEVENNIIERCIYAGISRPENANLVKHSAYLYSVTLKPGTTKHFYFSVVNKGGNCFFPISVSTKDSFVLQNQNEQLITGGIIGFMIFLFLILGTYFYNASDKTLRFFVLYVISICSFYILNNGYLHYALFTNMPLIEYRTQFFFLALSHFAILSFVYEFYNLKENHRTLYRIFKYFRLSLLPIAVMSFSYIPAFTYISYIILGSSVIVLTLVFLCSIIANKWSIHARYLLFAFSFIFVGITLYSLKEFGILPNVFVTHHAILFALTIELSIITLVLFAKIGRENAESTQKLELQTRNVELQKQKLQQAYSKLESSNKQLHEVSKLKSSILSNISHELRTPLNSILGFSEILLKSKDIQPEKVEKFAIQINVQGKKVFEKVENILDAARLDSGFMEIVYSEVHIAQLFNELNNYFQVYQYTNNYSAVQLIHIENKSDLYFTTDRQVVRQILVNIINNAFKFTKEGSISFGFECTNLLDKNALILFVEDTGIGMTDEQVAIAFDQFRQIDETNNRKYAGMGIGLSICKNLVTLLGGSIAIDTKRQHGIKVMVTLPQISKEN